jgi:hypothetical protein
MPKNKKLPPAKIVPTVIGEYVEEPTGPGWDGTGHEFITVIVFAEYTPEMGRLPASKGGWGRFSGVGSKGTAVRGAAAPAPV